MIFLATNRVLQLHCLLPFAVLIGCISAKPQDAVSRFSAGNSFGTKWIVNSPTNFYNAGDTCLLKDVRNMSVGIEDFFRLSDRFLKGIDSFTDGEVVDAMEHFFWGMSDGVAMELGALDGSPGTRSMTYDFERSFGWRRILVEGNPGYRSKLQRNSPLAFSANAAICSTATVVHYITSAYTGGIVEFMTPDFVRNFHTHLFNMTVPPGNLSSIDYSKIARLAKPVDCIPLSHVIEAARLKHINYFILDVEVSTGETSDLH